MLDTIEWKTNVQIYFQVYKSDKHQISFKDKVATLTINDLEIGDSGKYRCEAVNKISRVETEGKLTVYCKLKP